MGNEAAGTDEEDGTGGDIYAARGVTLTVVSSNFTKSLASYGGAAIECCGATISDSQFTATESAMTTVSRDSCCNATRILVEVAFVPGVRLVFLCVQNKKVDLASKTGWTRERVLCSRAR